MFFGRSARWLPPLLGLAATIAGLIITGSLPALSIFGAGRTGLEREGWEVVRAHQCLACHRVNGVGGRAASDLARLVDGDGPEHTPEAVEKLLSAHGAGNSSAPRLSLTEREKDRITAWLDYLKYRNTAALVESDPQIARGRALFYARGCVHCHSREGRGGVDNPNAKGGVIPNLLGLDEVYTEKELKEFIARGNTDIAKEDAAGPPPLLYMPAWKDNFSAPEMDELVAYLFGLKPVKKPGSAEAGESEEEEEW